MSEHVGIINLGAGNIGAIVNRLAQLNTNFSLIDKPTSVSFTHLILPGVGAFGNAMQKLEQYNLQNIILIKGLMNYFIKMLLLAFMEETL